MNIRALYNGDEIELSLNRKTIFPVGTDTNEYFVATNSDFLDLSIEITTRSGIVSEIKINGDLSINDNDDTLDRYNIIFQRAQDALTEFLIQESSGFQSNIGEGEGKNENKIKPYNPDDIKVRQDKFAIEYVVTKLIKKGIFDLNPEFQRKYVWDRKRQSRLIESIMLGIPIPIMYLSESVGEKFHVVDGLQRLHTFADFINNKFSLKDLEHLSDYEGCYFNEEAGKKRKRLDLKMITRIESYQLSFNIIEKTSPNEVKYDIFERINTGGMPLNSQEIRNCNAEEKVRNLLRDCANSDEFKIATDNSIHGKRMDDQELVLRFCGFYLERKKQIEYSGNMKQFLNNVNELLNKSQPNLLNELKAKFINSMRVCYYMFGKYAFRKCVPEDLLPDARKQFINKSMFVVWSVLTCNIDINFLSNNHSEEFFASTLANIMRTEVIKNDGTVSISDSDYNRIFSTATFDVKNLVSSFYQTQKILKQHNLINS